MLIYQSLTSQAVLKICLKLRLTRLGCTPYLKSQNLLTADQLKLLFSIQIIREICALFELSDGSFHFTSNVQLPYLEMIGTSIFATEVILPGLRNLQNWAALEDKLPSSTSGMISTAESKPQVQLNHQEWKIWEFADGTVPLIEIAQRIELSIDVVRRIVFRLTVAGLAEEIPLVNLTPATESETNLPGSELLNPPSSELLNQMLSFLKKHH